MIAQFESEHVEAKTKPLTAAEYKRALTLHVPLKLRHRPVGEITHTDMVSLHHDLSQKPGPSQANKALAILSKLFSWAEKNGLRVNGVNPCLHVDKNQETKRDRFLKPQELGRLGAALANERRPYVAAAIRLLLFTGARLNEILSARWAWVDFDRGTLRLPDSKTGVKTIYLNAPALAVLSELPRVADNPYIIVGDKDGAHLVNLQKPWRHIRKLADEGDVRLHELRHTFASFGVGGGLSLPMVGALLGHSQRQTTDRYAHLSADPMRAASDAIAVCIASAMAPNGSEGQIIEMRKK